MKGATIQSLLTRRNIIVSIHAPMKGATQKLAEDQYDSSVSIHAPMKGATLKEKAFFVTF